MKNKDSKSENVEWEGLKIYKTFDYDKFTLIKGNRKIKTFQVNKLKASYQKGQIPVPLIVNERHEIIDGQHRLEALRQLGLPVPYMIVKDSGIKEVQRLNTQQQNWTTENHLRCYVERGKEMYIKYDERIHQKFGFDHLTKISLIKGKCLTRGKGIQGQLDVFKDGKFEVTDEEIEHAISVGIKIEDVERYFYKHLISTQKKCLWNAVRKLSDHPDYNHSEMMRKLELQEFRIPRFFSRFKKLSTNEFLIILEDIYNHNRRGKSVTFYHELKQRMFTRDSVDSI